MIESSRLRQYTKKAICPDIKKHLIQLKAYDAHIQLKVPDYKIDSSTVEISGYENRNENAWYLVKTLNAHFDFCLSHSTNQEQRHDVALKRSIASVNSISLFFPDIRHEGLMICMVAWLETLCAVDDQLEDMNLEDVKEAIEEVISILRDEPIHTPRHASIVQTITKFKNHCKTHHHPSLLGSFFSETSAVFAGLLQEIYFKNETLPQALDTYLSIRRKTIGIKPFFALIRSAHAQTYPFTEEVTRLQTDIGVVAGLQNDLVGLERDIRTGEEMNAVVLLMSKRGLNKRDGGWIVESEQIKFAVGEVCRLHDAYMERVVKKIEGLRAWDEARDRGDMETVLATREMLFTQTHFEWCTTAKRYQAKVG